MMGLNSTLKMIEKYIYIFNFTLKNNKKGSFIQNIME